MNAMKALLIILLVCVSFRSHSQTKLVYVTAAKAKIKAEAKASAADVTSVDRGAELKVLSEAGSWYQLENGWISKLFVSPTKPIGKNDLLKESAVTDEQMSRKRASGYSVSAATRGLSASSRNERGEKFRSNNKALEQLEKQSLPEPEVIQFQNEAKANGK